MFKTPHLILNMQFGLAQNELYWHTLSRLKKIQGCDWYLLEIRLLWWQHFGTVGLAAACYGCIPLCGSVQVPVSLFPGHLSANPSGKAAEDGPCACAPALQWRAQSSRLQESGLAPVLVAIREVNQGMNSLSFCSFPSLCDCAFKINK